MGIISTAKSNIRAAYNIVLDVVQDIVLRKVDDRYLAFDSALNIYGWSEEERCLYLLPGKQLPLYCIEIADTSNLPRLYSHFEAIVEAFSFEEDSELTLVFSKSPMVIDEKNEDFCSKVSIYLFSPSPSIIEEIGNFFDVERKKPIEIFSALLDIGLSGRYCNDMESYDLKSELVPGHIPIDEMAFIFKAVFAEGVYSALTTRPYNESRRRYTPYQGIGFRSRFSQRKPNIIGALREDWRGYIAMRIMFSRSYVEKKIQQWYSSVRSFETDKAVRKAYQDFHDDIYPQESSKFLVVNTSAVIDNPLALQRIGENLNITFTRRHTGAKDSVYKTPIGYHNPVFDFLAYSRDVKRFITSVTKKHNVKTSKSKDIYGVDIAGNYVAYSFSESNSPHWSIIAPTRSGKTFFILKMISQALGAEIKKNSFYREDEAGEKFNEDTKLQDYTSRVIVENCKKMGGATRIVHFDIGYSGIKFAREMKRYAPDDVLLFEDNLNELRFGLTDIRWDSRTNKPNSEDVIFSLSIISLILSLNGEEELTASEKAAISEAIEVVFSEKKYEGLSIRKLREIGGYDDAIRRIEEKFGEVDEFKKTTELDLGNDLSFLQKPLPSDLIKYLSMKAENLLVPEGEREIAREAATKLKVVAEEATFAYYSQSNIKDSSFFYMELETIKGLGDKIFIPIFILIFQKLYRRDVIRAQHYKTADRVPPKVFYVIEESHNFFRIESLVELFEVVIREAARYNIHIGFITQNAEDIPERILYNIGTRIMLPSDKPEEQLDELKYYWKSKDSLGNVTIDSGKEGAHSTMDFFGTNAKKFYAFMKYGGGIITLKPPVTPEEEWLFNSNPTQV